MMTKTAFFALLNDKESRINPTAHIAVIEESNGNSSVIIRQHSAPNAFLSSHKATTTTVAAFTKYNAWLNEWLVAQTAAANAIEADHAEALLMNIEIDAGAAIMKNPAIRAYWLQCETMKVGDACREWDALHAEAIEMDKQATHFRREQAALSERVRAIMAKPTTNTENVIPMNKAKMKQNQTPDNLPRLQLVDVVRAALRNMPASQEQIEAVGDLSHKELRNLIIKMLAKGARVTAHLTKSKSAGYGFLTFGYNGQLPPGTYHKIVVSNMKNAREVASQYGAHMWNF